jgi:carboxyl-terminal processing protease
MTRLATRRIVATCTVFLLVVAATAAPPPPPREGPLTLQDWSNLVWQSARSGDRGALDAFLSELPREPDNENLRRLHEAVVQYNENLRAARVSREANRTEALERMRQKLRAGEVGAALTAAVEVQTISEDPREVLREPDVAEVVARAEAELPTARRDGDWLYAYELLFRLNVLFEHTGGFEKDLAAVNRRLSLLSYYAPRRLHELRQLQARRDGTEELGDFNPALVDPPAQRLDGITSRMVRGALESAAIGHIEGNGWRPLLLGGIEGVRLLLTTPDLAESLPGLRNRAAIDDLLETLDEQHRLVERSRDGDLGFRLCGQLLAALVDKAEAAAALPPEVVLREFGDGATAELDDFSEVIWPDKYHRFQQSTHGSFVGVGILIRHDDRREIFVVSPLEGTPAYYAGIKPNDRIAQVDGVATAGWSLNDAVDRITGEKGTPVTLGIRREGAADLVQVKIVRDVIKIRSVKGWWKTGLDAMGEPVWDWYIDAATRIAYVRLTAFNEDTYEDLKAAWRQITADGEPGGLILDLRFNPGGLLTSAVDVANLFLRGGVIVSGETKDGETAWPDRLAEPSKALIADSGVSTIVLINEGSASASEIVAGCLQAHGAAVALGMRTFGKGSVQTVHQIARKALLKLTTQYYRLPPGAEEVAAGRKGRLVHRRPGATEWGVEPDIVVTATPQEIKAAFELRQAADILDPNDEGDRVPRPDISDLITKGMDPQLEAALLILQARALGKVPVGETRHARAG